MPPHRDDAHARRAPTPVAPMTAVGLKNASTVQHHTTQAHAAYEPPHSDVSRPWALLIAGLLVTAVAGLAVHPVCLPEVPAANERAAGVRHEQHGTMWYHCEPWIRRALSADRTPPLETVPTERQSTIGARTDTTAPQGRPTGGKSREKGPGKRAKRGP